MLTWVVVCGLPSVAIVVSLFAPTVTREAVRLLNCSEVIDGVSYVKSDYRVQVCVCVCVCVCTIMP